MADEASARARSSDAVWCSWTFILRRITSCIQASQVGVFFFWVLTRPPLTPHSPTLYDRDGSLARRIRLSSILPVRLPSAPPAPRPTPTAAQLGFFQKNSPLLAMTRLYLPVRDLALAVPTSKAFTAAPRPPILAPWTSLPSNDPHRVYVDRKFDGVVNALHEAQVENPPAVAGLRRLGAQYPWMSARVNVSLTEHRSSWLDRGGPQTHLHRYGGRAIRGARCPTSAD